MKQIITEKELDKKVNKVMKLLYPKGVPQVEDGSPDKYKNMSKIYVQHGSFIISPNTISKKDFIELKLLWIKAVENKLNKKQDVVIVEVVPAQNKPTGLLAKPIGSKEKPLQLWFTTKYPKAMKSGTGLKRITGTKWKAVKSKDGWDAIEQIK